MGYVNGLALKLSWDYLLQQFQVEPKLGKKVLFELVSTYCSKDRHYHNLGHIQQVLRTVERIKPLANDFPAIQLAAWFHDVIYDPTAKDNEEQSAEYADGILTQLKIPEPTIATVRKMILNTKTHQAEADDIDSQILLDGDLTILGADRSDYQFYATGIRREYGGLSEADYRQGRIQVLNSLLARDRLYFTPLIFSELEATARQNMQAEIEALSK